LIKGARAGRQEMSLMTETKTLPLLPLRDIVVFPHMIVPLFVGREKSVRALEEVMRADKQILLATQKSAADDDPETDAIYEQGVVASVLQLLKLPDGTVKVLVEGGRRMTIKRFLDNEAYFEAEAELVEDTVADPSEAEALMRTASEKFQDYVKLNKKVPPEALSAVEEITEPAKMADTIAAHLAVKIAEKQELLANPSVSERLEKVFGLMEGEISVLQVEKKIRNRVKRQMEKTQR
jgi:ATP-dependent Lon protease